MGSCERRSELTEEMYIPLRPIPKEDSSWLMFLETGQVTEIGRDFVSDSWKVAQLNIRFQESVNNNNNNNIIIIIIVMIIIVIVIAFKGAVREFFTISSQRRELSPTRTLKWPRRNRV